MTSRAVTTDGREIPFDSGWEQPGYQNGLEFQVDQGFLDADTNLVTLTIGGNDARFLDIVRNCLGLTGEPRISGCSDAGANLPADKTELRTNEPFVIHDLLPPKLTATYQAIHAAAPNAAILLAGYPKLMPAVGNPICLGTITGRTSSG